MRKVDVTNDEHLISLFAGPERLDIHVPAAGISLGERELEWELFNRVLSVQLQAVYRTLDLGHDLLARNGGSIITLASMYSFFRGAGARPIRRRREQ